LGGTICFWEAYFHKIKGKKILCRTHNNLNRTDDNTKLTESFCTSTELLKAMQEFKIFVFEISFQFFIIYIFCYHT
jgi:hypothetical protein